MGASHARSNVVFHFEEKALCKKIFWSYGFIGDARVIAVASSSAGNEHCILTFDSADCYSQCRQSIEKITYA